MDSFSPKRRCMISILAEEWKTDLCRSLVIGDKPTDIKFEQAAICANSLCGPNRAHVDAAKTTLEEISIVEKC